MLHTTRAGDIWLNDDETGVNSVAGRIDVHQHDEEAGGARGWPVGGLR
ncbi:MAG: hypothetical protein AVDCRST_MAG06-2627 [uncultured Nocardioides sp.]|uniref:Uncharacterized protein n=1 Tax=uncultured Nocardioides sp. TaxID=198441 RepID=A0A6J4PDV1_9ACTN|nr:MAG: hypothetical protein AVDCRST_MAG06-2627 [uncultured Nocardioides sp.]